MIRSKTTYWLLGVWLFALCLLWMPGMSAAAEAVSGSPAVANGEESTGGKEETSDVPAVDEVDATHRPDEADESSAQEGTGANVGAAETTAAAAGQGFPAPAGTRASLPTGASLPFKDLARYQWDDGKVAIQAMSRTKIINGFPDGTFRPSELITRRQAAKIVAMAVGLPAAPANFVDVEPGLSYIGALQQAGIVSGDQQGRFRPDDHLTRAQLAKMIVLAYGLEMKAEPELSDVPDTDLGRFVRIAASNGIMTGYEDGTFRPNQPVKRDQAAVMIYRAMQLAGGGQAPDDGEDVGSGEDGGQETDDGTGLPDADPGWWSGTPAWSEQRPFRLFIDAGHGGEDPGAIGTLPDGSPIREKDINLDIALEIARIFREEYAYVDVKMSRSDDTFVQLKERSRQANEWGANYFVSIHVNSIDKPNVDGFESYIYNGPVTPETEEKQRIIHQYIVEKMGFRDRGPKRANFAVLRESKMPAILLENLFISNPTEAALLNDPAFRQRLARVTAEAIALAWNVPRYDELGMQPMAGEVDGTTDTGGTDDAWTDEADGLTDASSDADDA